MHCLLPIRPDIDRRREYIGRVLTIDQGKLFLLMPPKWWTELGQQEKKRSKGSSKKEKKKPAGSASPVVATEPPPPLCHIRSGIDIIDCVGRAIGGHMYTHVRSWGRAFGC